MIKDLYTKLIVTRPAGRLRARGCGRRPARLGAAGLPPAAKRPARPAGPLVSSHHRPVRRVGPLQLQRHPRVPLFSGRLPTWVTGVGSVAWVSEGQMPLFCGPARKGESPALPFRIYAVPLNKGESQ